MTSTLKFLKKVSKKVLNLQPEGKSFIAISKKISFTRPHIYSYYVTHILKNTDICIIFCYNAFYITNITPLYDRKTYIRSAFRRVWSLWRIGNL